MVMLVSLLVVWKEVNLTFGIQSLCWMEGKDSNARLRDSPEHLHNFSIYLMDALISLYYSDDAIIFKNSQHTGSVRGLSFNPFQSNLMASAAGNGEASTLIEK